MGFQLLDPPGFIAHSGVVCWEPAKPYTSLGYFCPRFGAQSTNSHLRNVVEILDCVELFSKDSSWIELWSSGNGKEIWKHLKPSEVRKKLGKSKDDPIYGYLSAHGTHPTFRIFQSRAVVDTTDESKKTARVFVAGVPLVHVRMFHCSVALIVVNLVVSRVVGTFGALLNEEEVISRLKNRVEAYKNFQKKHFVPWAKGEGLETDDLVQFLDKLVLTEGVKANE